MRAETASLGTVIEHEQVVQLPLNGRAFITLAALAPGVAFPSPNSQLPRVNGGRPADERVSLRWHLGVAAGAWPGCVPFRSSTPFRNSRLKATVHPRSSVASTEGVVNLTTKAGGNAFHGDGFEFLRNEALNARNFFQSTNPVKPEYRRNQYGGTLGGPVVKDRTFFFADYQRQRQSIARTVASTVPTLLQRQGIFTEAIAGRVPVIYDPATTVGSIRSPFAGNAIPSNRIDPVALSLLQRYPLPAAAGTANNYSRTDNENDNQDQWDARIDHKFGLESRPGIRPPDVFPRRLRPGDAAAGREWE